MITITYIDINNITHEKQYDDNVISIDLSRRNITEIKGLNNLSNLRELNLSDNMITEIKGLDYLVNLQELNLCDNMITELKGLNNLINLQSLDLSRNMITEIKNIDNLVNLHILDLSKNKITEIKNINNLVNLQELFLSGNRITEIKGLDNLVNLQILHLNYNMITEIKGLDNLVNLQELYLSDNTITEIKSLNNLVNLQILYLSNNMITEIKGLDNLVNLQELYLSDNTITEIKNLNNLVNLQILYLSDNTITEIKNLNNLVNLQKLYLSNNMITEIKNIDNLINLQELDLSNNKIIEIPLTILNNINLTYFSHDVIIVNPIITRFLNRNKIKKNKIAVYNDNQNVHNSDINKSISKSIYAILNTFEKINDLNDILCDPILTTQTKESLVEYCACNDVHSTLNVTFNEVLQSVWCIIQKHADSIEIKRILNAEMSESICKCFTGRLSRLINTLNGFDDRVCIMISNNDAIGNIIVMTIAKNKDKNIIEQKEICKLELLSRGYTKDIIDEWIEYI